MVAELIRLDDNKIIKTKSLLTEKERADINLMKVEGKTKKDIEKYLMKNNHIIL